MTAYFTFRGPTERILDDFLRHLDNPPPDYSDCTGVLDCYGKGEYVRAIDFFIDKFF